MDTILADVQTLVEDIAFRLDRAVPSGFNKLQ